MTPPLNGEIPFEAGGRALTLRYGTNALVRLETLTGKSAPEVFKEMGTNPPVRLLRTVFAAGITSTPRPTEDEVGDMMDELSMEKVGTLITQAVEAAYPTAEDQPGKPRTKAAGTGSRS